MSQSILDDHYFDEAFGIQQTEQEETIDQDVGIFEKLCMPKLQAIDFSPAEIVAVNKFISTIDRINNRYPFLHLPYFLKDFIDGEYSNKIIHKFNLWSYMGLNYIVENILKFNGRREKKHVENAINKNLEKEGWQRNYEFFMKYSQLFKDELLELLNHNILNALILCQLFKGSVNKSAFIRDVEKHVQTYEGKIMLITEQEIKNDFHRFLESGLEEKTENILRNLQARKYIKYEVGSASLYPKYSDIPKMIMGILNTHPDGIKYDTFRRKLLRENNLLRSIPKMGIWEPILEDFEKDGKIVKIKAFWRYSPYRDQLFTLDLFKKKHDELRKQIAAAGSTKFFGRRMTPEQFMKELEQLDKGSLDEKDDQITRLAGMVLASSNFPQAPKEELKIFDFAIDISNHKFTHEQIAAMSKLNFAIIGKIIHVKTMLHEKVTYKDIEEIRDVLPQGQQAVIITFQEISKKLKDALPENKSIQILGREAIQTWCQITPVIPCRVNSIAKVAYGELRGKMVKVNSIDYESGLASISSISTDEESTVPVGSLEETWISDCNVNDYDSFARNYEEFLRVISHYSEPGVFDKAFSEITIKQIGYNCSFLNAADRYYELDPSERLSIFVQSTGVMTLPNPIKIEWRFRFGDANTNILYDLGSFDDNSYKANEVNYRIRRHFNCNCHYWENVTHSFKFCKHVISALDFMVRKMDCLNYSWKYESENVVWRLLKRFVNLNGLSSIDFLAFSFFDYEIDDFLTYLGNLPCSDSEGGLKESELNNLKTRMLQRFDNDPVYADSFQKVEDAVKHMNKKTLNKVENEILVEFRNQARRAKASTNPTGERRI